MRDRRIFRFHTAPSSGLVRLGHVGTHAEGDLLKTRSVVVMKVLRYERPAPLSVAPLDRATVIRLASLREHHVVPPPAPTGPRGALPTDVLGRGSVLMSSVPLTATKSRRIRPLGIAQASNNRLKPVWQTRSKPLLNLAPQTRQSFGPRE